MRPSSDTVLMEIAQTIAQRSTCSRLNVGAIITREKRVLSTGYNGSPAGQPHCIHTDDAPCLQSVHAEANAIAFAAKHGVATQGATLYTTHTPCLTCAFLLVNAGIVRVVYDLAYRDFTPMEFLMDAGVHAAWIGNLI